MSLAKAQALFYDHLTGRSASSQELDACFQGTPELPALERLNIYANMYLWRQVDALREDFPKLAAILGDEPFFSHCEAYLAAHRSQSPDLGKLGRNLSPFTRTAAGLAQREALADLAALEWARAEVFFEATAEPVGADAMAAVPAEAVPGAVLRFVPAFRLLSVGHEVVGLWRQLDREEPADAPSAVVEPTRIAIWRPAFEAFHTPIEGPEALGLDRAVAGASIEQICDAFGQLPQPAASAFAAISSWIHEGWVAEIVA